MHISLETPEKHAIQSYSDKQIQIASIVYDHSLIVSKQEIVTELAIKNIQDINEYYLELLLKQQPELIIIGHNNTDILTPIEVIAKLAQEGIGIEFMSIGAACRTYNVLLSELRAVVMGIILM